MRLFKRSASRADDVPGSADELLAEIRRLTAANRAGGDRATERQLLRLRHRAGTLMLQRNGAAPEYPEPDFAMLPPGPLPPVAPADLTPGLLRAGILRDGCLLVRGLVRRDDALRLAGLIDRAFAARDALDGGSAGDYEPLEPEPPFELASSRPWVQQGGGLLATDAPRAAYELLELFETAGVTRLAAGYLGEPPLLSMHKTTLRKAEPSTGGAWHQDGAFMGGARALNLWLALSRCGDRAPGLDVVPRRLERVVIEHDAMLDVPHTRRMAEEAAGDVPIMRPIFEPGDALFFDDLFLHQTAADPSMSEPRFAVESWFFGGSAFPADYAPIAV